MSRGAPAALVLAVFGAGPAAAEPPPARPQSAHRPPGILGTLNPKTGAFTPDATPAAPTDIVGTLEVSVKLDATHFTSTSVACVIRTVTRPADAIQYYHENDPEALYLNFYQPTSKFFGSASIPFALPQPAKIRFLTTVSIECRYTFDPRTQIYQSQYLLELHAGENTLTVGGVMDGLSF